MKTLKLFSALFLTALMTMSMGFPTDLADKNKKEKKSAVTTQCTETKRPVANTTSEVTEIIEEPVQALSMLVSSNISNITVKVFDVKGMLVMAEEVSMNDFLGNNKKFAMPSGSTFIMFHQNTAYYYLETGLLN